METPLLSEQQAALRKMPAVAAVEATKTLAAAGSQVTSLATQMRNASGGYATAREADRCVMRPR
jgi:ClpP class serine protease